MTSSAQLNTDIAIVGGGLVGASLALLLSQHLPKAHITLIEAGSLTVNHAQPYQSHFDARSTALSSSSLNILHPLDLNESLNQSATFIQQVHVSDRGHMGSLSMTAEDCGEPCLGAVVENAFLGRILNQNLQSSDNIHCLASAQVSQLQVHRQGAHLKVIKDQQESKLTCQLAVIADGAASPLRQSLGIRTHVTDYEQQAIIANVSHAKPHEGLAFERFTDQGPLALLPLDGFSGRRSALVWTHPQAEAETTMALDDPAFLQKLQDRFGYRLGQLEKVGQRQTYPLQLVVAAEQVRSSMVLMGNAAHFLHPLAGQGFNLALRDCAMLTQILQQAWREGRPLGELKILESYAQAQTQDQDTTILLSHNFNRLFSNDQLLPAMGRNLGLLGLGLLTPAKRVFARQMMGLNSSAPFLEQRAS